MTAHKAAVCAASSMYLLLYVAFLSAITASFGSRDLVRWVTSVHSTVVAAVVQERP